MLTLASALLSSLVRPTLDYTGWDADSMQGCVCDYGYSGYDCSRRTCPYGIDPLSSGTPVLEKLTLVCRASSGYFNIQIFGKPPMGFVFIQSLIASPFHIYAGYSTPAIKHDFGPAALKHVLESIPGMGTVTVETATAAGTGRASVCGSSYLSETAITLNSYVGPTPPRMYVTSGSSSNSRLSPKGATSLAGDSMALYMQTTFTLTCPVCAGCDAGVIWFALGDSISDEVLLHTPYSSAADIISSVISGIEDLANGGWENLEVSVIANDDDTSVCNSGATNSFTVSIKSSYGNLPYIELVGGAWREHERISLTWESDSFQDGDPLQCSGQGYCNITSGRCDCTRFYESNKLQFEMQSGDGQGNPGTRGDCGYYKRTKLSSASAACHKSTNATNGDRSLCSGHGECLSTLSDACTCYSGWSGILCDIAISCPSGPAWFDEPLSTTVAHQSAVCSNMGHCDDSTGRCQCREGFHGAACQYMDCPRDNNGRACSGKGWCMNMNKWAEIAGFEYGDESNPRIEPAAWDAFGFHACMCSAGHPTPYSLSGVSNTLYPTVGPMTMLNGLPTETPGLPGWRGYNCQERNCPSGNRIVSPATNSAASAVFEEQIIGCTGDNSPNSSFTLSFYGHETTLITGDMGAAAIKAAIEWPPTVGNVTISFLNGLSNSTACHSSYDENQGFVVRFDTELGNIPLLQEVSSENLILNISQRVAGTLVRNVVFLFNAFSNMSFFP